jgi:hypothetical protein
MPSRWKLATLTVLTILCGRVSDAQVPSTPAGHQLSEWLRVQDSLDPATMQEFIEKYMPFARVEGMLANRKQTGGFDIKRVQESIRHPHRRVGASARHSTIRHDHIERGAYRATCDRRHSASAH